MAGPPCGSRHQLEGFNLQAHGFVELLAEKLAVFENLASASFQADALNSQQACIK